MRKPQPSTWPHSITTGNADGCARQVLAAAGGAKAGLAGMKASDSRRHPRCSCVMIYEPHHPRHGTTIDTLRESWLGMLDSAFFQLSATACKRGHEVLDHHRTRLCRLTFIAGGVRNETSNTCPSCVRLGLSGGDWLLIAGDFRQPLLYAFRRRGCDIGQARPFRLGIEKIGFEGGNCL